MSGFLRAGVILCALVLAWDAIGRISGTPDYILPPPWSVVQAFWMRRAEIGEHSAVTLIEIALGLVFGVGSGLALAHLIIARPATRDWLMPLSIASQAIPVFALAPILVLWLGYGLASKVVMTALIVFFPVTAAAYDGLRRCPHEIIDVARTMLGDRSDAERRILWHVRWPMALPVLAPGLKVATAISPIGAVIGEWVGASSGLGHAMLKANSRAETDMMFACAIVLMAMGVGLYALTDFLLQLSAPWAAFEKKEDE